MPLRADPDAVGEALLDAVGLLQRCAVLLSETDPSTRGRWSVRVSAVKLAALDLHVDAADGDAWQAEQATDDEPDEDPA
jgi:hypothetical protein